MQSNRGRDTLPELAARSALYREGFRFRVHYKALPSVRGDVDIALTRHRLAVFIDGCFWHGCPLHATRPATNREWWGAKLDGNISRDARTNAALVEAGWSVLRFWEHTPSADIVRGVRDAVDHSTVAK